VVHFDLPKNLESYYQETGRAGRDGLPAEALLLFGRRDISLVRTLIQAGENPAQNRIELSKLSAMVDFAEAQTCRRRKLLGYFGELGTIDCGNCDVCLNAPITIDATEEAKLVLLTIYGLQQRFGMKHVVDVLRGAQGERVTQLGHREIATFGKGSGKPMDFWMAVVRQLIQQGVVKQDEANFNVLKLTPLSRPILREGARFVMPAPRVRVGRSRGRMSPDVLDHDEALFQKLRALRRRIAGEEGVPPYVVFGDQTLRDMASAKPRTRTDLLLVSGVGERKLQRYGERFLEAIRGEAG
jgi:ATP-dependent DNA helicase RecQ